MVFSEKQRIVKLKLKKIEVNRVFEEMHILLKVCEWLQFA